MPPTIGITAGDPAGIGLEVILKSVPEFRDVKFVLFADRAVVARHEERFSPIPIPVCDVGTGLSVPFEFGQPTVDTG